MTRSQNTSQIIFKIHDQVTPEEVIQLFEASGLNRPTHDPERIKKMLNHANLTVTARRDGKLIGIARALTDFSYCCYLSDLAITKEEQRSGIGKKLIQHLRDHLGPEVSVILRSAPGALEYYPKIGFDRCDASFIIKRNR